MCNVELRIEFSEVLIIELSSVIRDDGMRQSKSVDDGFLDEVFHFVFGDLGQGFSLHLLGEIVYSDHYELSLAKRREKRIEYVDSPLSKRPGCDDGC